MQPAVAERVALQGLTIQLGPDLRTTYPVVMNFNISGQVNVTGPADPQRLQLQGTIKLDSGEVSHPPPPGDWPPTWPHLTLLQILLRCCCMPRGGVRAVYGYTVRACMTSSQHAVHRTVLYYVCLHGRLYGGVKSLSRRLVA